MYASVRRYSVGAGSLDALMHRIDEELAPAIGQEPGFVCYLVRDHGDRTIESTSVFADEASALRSDALVAGYAAEELAEFELTLIERVGGEIRVGRAVPGALQAVHAWRTGRAQARGDTRPGGEVLVVGATGRTGRQIVERLVSRGIRVSALVRRLERAQAILPRTTRLFLGDLRDPDTLALPMAGARAVIIATSGSASPENSAVLVDFFGTENVLKAAAEADVGLVVFVSSIYASRADYYQDVEPSSLGWKARAEELVRQSGLPYCIVRAGWLTDGPGGEPLALTQGDTGEGHLSRADLAAVCTDVLFRDDALGRTFEVVAAHDAGVTLDAALPALKPDPLPLAPAARP